jgi:hypothetical protein
MNSGVLDARPRIYLPSSPAAAISRYATCVVMTCSLDWGTPADIAIELGKHPRCCLIIAELAAPVDSRASPEGRDLARALGAW